MVMSYIWAGMIALSIFFSLITGQGSALGASVLTGAQGGITLGLSLGGAMCLWSALGHAMEKSGIMDLLARLARPLVGRVFPGTKKDPVAAGYITANLCANFLGLGNAATPMGIAAARRLAAHARDGVATDELCRLVVMNTASIQLIPANVAAVRASLGCGSPFDILPAVWVTSLCSVAAGLLGARLMAGRKKP